jgi:hypothetical protein
LPDADTQRRDLRLDAFRGLAQGFIFLDHIPNNAFDWVTLRHYGFSDTTEIFFFVSGYTCALAYGHAERQHGWSVTVARIVRRAFEIYVGFLLLVIACAVAVHVLAGGDRAAADATNTALLFARPGAALTHAVTLTYMPVNTDVLPTFVLMHLGFVPLLFVLHRLPALALAGAFAVYLIVQVTGLNLPAWPDRDWYFNPFAWQVLVALGAWCAIAGRSTVAGLLRSNLVLIACLGYLAFSLVVVLGWEFDSLKPLIPEALAKLIYPVDKSSLSPWRLAHFLALAIVVIRLIPLDARWLKLGLVTAAIRCGEHSLAIYALGVVLAFAAGQILGQLSNGIAMQAAVSLAGLAIMIAAATLLTAATKLGRHDAKLF